MKKLTTIYFGQAIKQESEIKKLSLDNKSNNYCQGQGKPIVLNH